MLSIYPPLLFFPHSQYLAAQELVGIMDPVLRKSYIQVSDLVKDLLAVHFIGKGLVTLLDCSYLLIPFVDGVL